MKRVLSIILAAAMLCCILALAACKNKDTPTTVPTDSTAVTTNPTTAPTGSTAATTNPTTAPTGSTAATTNSSTTPEKPIGEYKRPGFEDVDFDGKVFTIAVPVGKGDGWDNYDIAPDDENSPDPLDQAILKRNKTIEELYNCKIVQKSSANPIGELESDFATGKNTIDMVADRYALPTFSDGNFYNVNNLNLDLTKEWFDQGFVRDMTIDGKLYALCGDFSIESFEATWAMFVNLDVLEKSEKIKNVNIFDLVRNHEWTLDKMLELCRYAKVNGGSEKMTLDDPEDVFGLISSSEQIIGLYIGGGNVFVSKTDDENGNSSFEYGENSEPTIDTTDLIIEIVFDPSVSIPQSYIKVSSAFQNGQTLFASGVMSQAKNFAKSGVKFSVIPEPLLNTEQKTYYHHVDNHASYYAVPKTCSDIDVISDFIELLAYHSRFISYREYLNLYKDTYSFAGEDSYDMFDIIAHNRRYDAGYELQCGGFAQTYAYNVLAGPNTIPEPIYPKFDRILQEAAKKYKEKINSYNDGIAS